MLVIWLFLDAWTGFSKFFRATPRDEKLMDPINLAILALQEGGGVETAREQVVGNK
jgi:hypothetical protein